MNRNIPLTTEELNWLQTFANGVPRSPPGLAILARLESLDLLMRGWGSTYVVTGKGHAVLGRRAA